MILPQSLKKRIVALLLAAFCITVLVSPLRHVRAQVAGGEELAAAALEIGLNAGAITAVAWGMKTLNEALAGVETATALIPDAFIGAKIAVPTVDIGTATKKLIAKGNNENWWKEYVIDPITNLTAKIILRTLTNQILAWIQGGDVGFVDNLTRQTRIAADEAGGQFLNNLADMNLCGNIYASLNIMLQTPPLHQRFTCTLTDIVRNVESFYRNFEQGGWAAFLRINIQPQNNIYGAFLIALDTKLQKERSAQERDEKTLLANKGFLGVRVPVRGNCDFRARTITLPPSVPGRSEQAKAPGRDPNQFAGSVFALPSANAQPEPGTRFRETGLTSPQLPQEELGRFIVRGAQEGFSSDQIRAQLEAGDFACDTEYQIKTSGEIIAHGLNKSVWSGLDVAVAADEINESIAAIINALVNKIIRASATIARGGGGVSAGGTTGTLGGYQAGPGGTITAYGGQTQGMFDPELTRPARIDPQQFGVSNLPGQNIFINSVFESYAILGEINAKLTSARNLLFAKHKAIDDVLQSNIAPGERARQLASLRAEAARLDALVAKRLEQKRKILNAQAQLLSSKGIFFNLGISHDTAATQEEIQTAFEQWQAAIQGLATEEIASIPKQTREETLDIQTALNSAVRPVARDTASAAQRIIVEERKEVGAEQQLIAGTIAEIDRIAATPSNEVCKGENFGEQFSSQLCFNRGQEKERLASERAVLNTQKLLLETKFARISKDEEILNQPQTNKEEAARTIVRTALDINRDVGAVVAETSTVDAVIRPIYQ